jgi:hypothetical protein
LKTSIAVLFCSCALSFAQVEAPPSNTTQPPPLPPRPADVRMPDERGIYVGVTAFLPSASVSIREGVNAGLTSPGNLDFPGRPKIAPGIEVGIAAGAHNTLRFSYFQAKTSGNTVAATDLTLWNTDYNAGDYLSTTYRLRTGKVSFEYLTWPYPVGSRKFRLKTLWQAQVVNVQSTFDAPLKDPSSPGAFFSQGARTYVLPAFGLGITEYASRNFRFEVSGSGFAIPHHANLWDVEAAIAGHVGHFELRGGLKAFHFQSTPQFTYYMKGTLVGGFAGIRWYL